MNIRHLFAALFLRRRATDWRFCCTADVVTAMRRDCYNQGRRHGDELADVRATQVDRDEITQQLTALSTKG